ncbi:MAG: signal recognition particle protein [Candidatus Amoebophilus sp. 36-38]|nr:MAG: signal recognition particle protein [Candidatus Amoebophilus sp. 36-38]
MFENLSNNLARAIKNLRGQGKITELNVATTVKEIRRALIQADVNYKVAKQITDDIKVHALGRNVLAAVSPGQLFTKVVSDELIKLMGSEKATIDLTGKPAIVLMAGLQGSGKTTFSAKLANYLKKQNKSILLVACDVYRPAATDQLQVLGQQIDVEVFTKPNSKDAIQIAKEAIEYAKRTNKEVVIIDTAGRQTVDVEMMQEIRNLKETVKPSETLFVVDAMAGQDAVTTAQAFHDQLNFDGVVLTKLDGDSRGGAALSIRAVIDKPIKFIGLGEKLTDLDLFYPDRMAQRILGMGDVISLVERAEQVYDEEQARKLSQKLRKNQFNLDDFFLQIQQLKKMGNLKDLVSMIPGMNKVATNLGNLGEENFKAFETMIYSMTPQERAQPSLLNSSRRTRVAKGSGLPIQEINRLLKQYENMCQLMKQSQKGGMQHMLQLAKKIR